MILLILKAGGPVYDIPKGRKDGRRSKIEDTRNLPPPIFNASQLIQMFGQHGLSAQEMVALSGKYITSFEWLIIYDYVTNFLSLTPRLV